MIEFKLPDIGEGLSEAELLEWNVAVGDEVREGDEVAVISTDKVNVELTAPASGRVADLIGEPGDVISVGTLIMRIEPQAQVGAEVKPSEHPPPGSEARPQPDNGSDDGLDDDSGASQDASLATPGKPAAKTAAAGTRIKAAPIVRRLAAERGIDLAGIEGSGPDGQILTKDLDIAIGAAAGPGGSGSESGSAVETLRLSGARLAAV